MIIKKVIKSPYDLTYPLDKTTYERKNVLYHGTSSTYCANIELHGWEINRQPYNINDIREICQTFEMLHYTDNNNYQSLRAFTLGTEGQYAAEKAASFTDSYWEAREYAWNLGGETMMSLLHAIHDLEERIISLGDGGPSMVRLSERLREIKTKYAPIVTISYPVIFVIQEDPRLFAANRDRSDMLAKASIPAIFIIARVDFPNSIARYHVDSGQGPRFWDKKAFLRNLRRIRGVPGCEGFVKFYLCD